MPLPNTDSAHYHAQIGLLDKGHTIEESVFCWGCYLNSFNVCLSSDGTYFHSKGILFHKTNYKIIKRVKKKRGFIHSEYYNLFK